MPFFFEVKTNRQLTPDKITEKTPSIRSWPDTEVKVGLFRCSGLFES